jgi:DUF971 family protein
MRPTAITADRTRSILIIAWDDGRAAEYPFEALAAACPCASCNEEREALAARGLNPDTDFRPKSTELAAIEPVGVYAIHIAWKDGCRYGIFSWEFLTRLASTLDLPGWDLAQGARGPASRA